MKDILKIVITGGPCAGKTTAMTRLQKFLEGEGYHVIICDETARWLIESGFKPFGPNTIELLSFQDAILEYQLLKENFWFERIQNSSAEKLAILFDRGILDNRAYLKPGEFEELAKQRGITEDEILARYNMVIHLVSTAVDKPDAYIVDGTRTEPIEVAVALDEKTMKTWEKHPNHPIINNNCSFDEKIEKVIDEIRRYLKIRKNKNRRKYLIKGIIFEKLEQTPVEIIKLQFRKFLGYDNNGITHIYTETIDNEVRPSWSFTETYRINDGEEITKERPISREEYNSALRTTENEILEKTRYIFITPDRRIFRMDVNHSGYNFSTVEVDDAKALPAIFRNAIDITGNESFKDENLLKNGKKIEKDIPKGYRKTLR